MPLNHVWAMDLTGKMDSSGQIHNILGLVEHGSRAELCLVGLKDKASITLLRHLLDAVEKYGKPKFLRTDNEAVFSSRVVSVRALAVGDQAPENRQRVSMDEREGGTVLWNAQGKAQPVGGRFPGTT